MMSPAEPAARLLNRRLKYLFDSEDSSESERPELVYSELIELSKGYNKQNFRYSKTPAYAGMTKFFLAVYLYPKQSRGGF